MLKSMYYLLFPIFNLQSKLEIVQMFRFFLNQIQTWKVLNISLRSQILTGKTA